VSEFVYPEVYVGCQVEFATEPGAVGSQWRLGQVAACKNRSCDLILFTPGGPEYRNDCWHVDDPRCKQTPHVLRERGRGVFRVTRHETMLRAVPEAMAKINQLERMIENMVTDDPQPARRGR
jgi:hypothetical protein